MQSSRTEIVSDTFSGWRVHVKWT